MNFLYTRRKGVYKVIVLVIVSYSLILIIWDTKTTENSKYSTPNEGLLNVKVESQSQNNTENPVSNRKNLDEHLKYVLFWTPFQWDPMHYTGPGREGFLKRNCAVTNCYFTGDKNLFGGDLSKFDAVLFNGRNVFKMVSSQLPQNRSPHQKYIFFEMESADNYPVCNKIFDNFFNFTATYKLNSDVIFSYVIIRNKAGVIVGPKENMHWEQNMGEVDEVLAKKIQSKKKAAVWFVSHCFVRNKREELVKEIQKELANYGLDIDIYGGCGTLKCSTAECNAKLENDYFFYLSFENSFAEDYVTEKLLTPLTYAAVPIVYGGADYSRFLPPDTYLDALVLKPKELAAKMDQLIKSPELYRQYFRWRNHYTYSCPMDDVNICNLCASLNDVKFKTFYVYENFRGWWHPNYTSRCQEQWGSSN